MQIKISNLSTYKRIQGVKAIRYAFGVGLREAINIFDVHDVNKGQPFFVIGNATEPIESITKYIQGQGSFFDATRNLSVNRLNLEEVQIDIIPEETNIKTKGSQAFNVPNTAEGKMFLKLLAKFINRNKFSFKNKGRGSRKHAGDRCSIPLQDSEWIAVYLRNNQSESNDRKQIIELKRDIQELQEETTKQLADAEKLYNQLKQENETLKAKIKEPKTIALGKVKIKIF